MAVCSHSAAVIEGSTLTLFRVTDCGESSTPLQSISFSSAIEHVCWSKTGTYAVVADAAGGLNFMMRDGQVLFRHPLLNQTKSETQAFGGVAFVNVPGKKGSIDQLLDDELVVLATDGRIFHFSGISVRLLSEAKVAESPSSKLIELQKRMVTRVAKAFQGDAACPLPPSLLLQLAAEWGPTQTRILVSMLPKPNASMSDEGGNSTNAASTHNAPTVETWVVDLDRDATATTAGKAPTPLKRVHVGRLSFKDAAAAAATETPPAPFSAFLVPGKAVAGDPAEGGVDCFDCAVVVSAGSNGSSVEWWTRSLATGALTCDWERTTTWSPAGPGARCVCASPVTDGKSGSVAVLVVGESGSGGDFAPPHNPPGVVVVLRREPYTHATDVCGVTPLFVAVETSRLSVPTGHDGAGATAFSSRIVLLSGTNSGEVFIARFSESGGGQPSLFMRKALGGSAGPAPTPANADGSTGEGSEAAEGSCPVVEAVRRALQTFLASLQNSSSNSTTAVEVLAGSVKEALSSEAAVASPSSLLKALRALAPVVPLPNSFVVSPPSTGDGGGGRGGGVACDSPRGFAETNTLPEAVLQALLAPATTANSSEVEVASVAPPPLILLVFNAASDAVAVASAAWRAPPTKASTALSSSLSVVGDNGHGRCSALLGAIAEELRDSYHRVATAALVLQQVAERATDDSNLNNDAHGSSSSSSGGETPNPTPPPTFPPLPPIKLRASAAWSLAQSGGSDDAMQLCEHALSQRLVRSAAIVWRRHVRFALLPSGGGGRGGVRFGGLLSTGVAPGAPQPSASSSSSSSSGGFGATLLRIDDGQRVVELLDCAPLDVSPSAFAEWVEDEVLPLLTPRALASVRRWAHARAGPLQEAHPRSHPAWALTLCAAVERGCRKTLGVAASGSGLFARWQQPLHALASHRQNCAASGSGEGGSCGFGSPADGVGATPVRSLEGRFAIAAEPTPFASAGHHQQSLRRESPTGVHERQSPPCAGDDDGSLRLEHHSALSGADTLWVADALSATLSRLQELSKLWDAHGLELALQEYASLQPEAVAFALLDRSSFSAGDGSGGSGQRNGSSGACLGLGEHVRRHVFPFAVLRGLDLDAVLLSYVAATAEAMARRPPTRLAKANLKLLAQQRRRATLKIGAAGSSSSGGGGGSSGSSPLDNVGDEALEAEAIAAEALTDEHVRLSERGVAALACIGRSSNPSSPCRPEDGLARSGASVAAGAVKASQAALSLLRAAVPPLAPGIKALAEDVTTGHTAVRWGFAVTAPDDEVREAARLLRIQEIVAHHRVANFNVMDPSHASRLVNFLVTIHDGGDGGGGGDLPTAESGDPNALDDALHICAAYSHLSPVHVLGRFAMNLLEKRAPREDELACLFGRLPKRSDALLCSDQLLHFCLDNLEDGAVAAAHADGGDGEKAELYDRFATTALRVVSYWAEEASFTSSSSTPSYSTASGSCSLHGTSGAGSSGPAVSHARLAASPSSLTRDHAFAFAVAGPHLCPPCPPALAGGKEGWHSSRGGGGVLELLGELQRLVRLSQRFGVRLTLASLRCPVKRTKAMNLILQRSLLPSNTSGSVIGEKLEGTVEGALAVVPQPKRKSRGKKKKSDGAPSSSSSSFQSLSAPSPATSAPSTASQSSSVVLESLRHASKLLDLPWPSVAGLVAKWALAATSGEADGSTSVGEARGVGGAPRGFAAALAICDELWAAGAIAFRAGAASTLALGAAADAADAALALRDVAEALSRAILVSSSATYCRGGNAGSKLFCGGEEDGAPPPPLAAAQALLLLQRSATICDAFSLPKAVDLLQSAEIVAAVLSRTEGGERYEQGGTAILAMLAALPSCSEGGGAQGKGKGRGGVSRDDAHGETQRQIGAYAAAAAPLHGDWDRGDGLLLPPLEAQALATSAALSELRDRAELHKFGALESLTRPLHQREGSSSSSGHLLALTPHRGGGHAAGGVDDGGRHDSTGALVAMLSKHGAAKLAMRLLLGAVRTSVCALEASEGLVPALTAVADAAASRARPDFSLAYGAITALPNQRTALSVCNRMIGGVIDGDRDYRRLATLAAVSSSVSVAWRQPELSRQYARRRRQAQWWRRLELLGIPFDHRALTPPMTPPRASSSSAFSPAASTAAAYASSLVPALLQRWHGTAVAAVEVAGVGGQGGGSGDFFAVSGGQGGDALAAARDFAREFGVDDFVPALLFAEGLLLKANGGGGGKADPGEGASEGLLSQRDVSRLDLALFGDGVAFAAPPAAAAPSSKSPPPPLALVLRLLKGVLKCLNETDYERIEYVNAGLLRANSLATTAAADGEPSGTSGGGFEQADSPPFLLPAADARSCERSLEVLGLVKGLNLLLPEHVLAAEGGLGGVAPSPTRGRRVPFFSLLAEPRTVLTRLVTRENVHKVSLVGRPLGLRQGECYALLLRSLYGHRHEAGGGGGGGGPNENGQVQQKQQPAGLLRPLPSRADTAKWLLEIGDPALVAETSEWVAGTLTERPAERRAALEGALRFAQLWEQRHEPSEVVASGEAVRRVRSSLLKLNCELAVRSVDPNLLAAPVSSSSSSPPSSSPSSLSSSSSSAVGGSTSVERGGSVKSAAAAVVVLGDLLENPQELVAELYRAAAHTAARAALAAGQQDVVDYDLDLENKTSSALACSAKGLSLGVMEEFHCFARRVLCSVNAIAAASAAHGGGSKAGVVPVHHIRQKLVQEWLERPLSAEALPSASSAQKGPARQGHAAVSGSSSLLAAPSSASSSSVEPHSSSSGSGQGGGVFVDDSRSVFRTPAKKRAEMEDAEASLKVSLLLSPLEDSKGEGVGSSAGIASGAAAVVVPWRSEVLKTLLEVAHGRVRSAKQASRTELRALRALSLVATPDEVAKFSSSFAAAKGNEGGRASLSTSSPPPPPSSLGALALYGVRLGQAAWLEELRLPTQGLLGDGTLAEPLARSLWRDHRRDRLLAPSLADLLLTVAASSPSSSSSRLTEDGELWMGVLRALRDQGHWRDLLDFLPRLSLALGTTAAGLGSRTSSSSSSSSSSPSHLKGAGASSSQQKQQQQQLDRQVPWACVYEEELATLWNDTLRKPLLELQHRLASSSSSSLSSSSTLSPASRGTGYTANSGGIHSGAFPTLASSIVFGSSIAPEPASIPTETPPPASSSVNYGGGLFGGLDPQVVLPVLDTVVEGLKTCPYASTTRIVDVAYFSHTLHALADAAEANTAALTQTTGQGAVGPEKFAVQKRAAARHVRRLAKRAETLIATPAT